LLATDIESMHVTTLPPHGHLNRHMQIAECHATSYKYAPPDRRPHISQRHFQAENACRGALGWSGGFAHFS
jgi:hypothetical protein